MLPHTTLLHFDIKNKYFKLQQTQINWNSLEVKGKCYAMKKREAFEAAENKEYRKFIKRKKM